MNAARPASVESVNGSRPPCGCRISHAPRFVVVTGGPGSGKTALLEIAQRHFCKHVIVLPESASILFGGGFPRLPAESSQRAAQRAIFYVQRELERLASADSGAAVVLCDRGTLDGLAYWPGARGDFFSELSTTLEQELAHYAAVVHLRTPSARGEYNHVNPLRTESQEQATLIDEKILDVWAKHPHRVVVPSAHDFMQKVLVAVQVIESEVPECCRGVGSRIAAQAGAPASGTT